MEFKDLLVHSFLASAGGTIAGLIVAFAIGESIKQSLSLIIILYLIGTIMTFGGAILIDKLLSKNTKKQF